ncbi:MAG: hypothetical protein EYC62_02460 [Alphaproteobacteria bacterium]|nr:MAG: hypothetical protein EYC62_02460 [Alphaproteobacteria bacterium]
MNWLLQNYELLLQVVTSVIAAASAISALTPTSTDNYVVDKVKSIVDVLALNIGHARNSNS